MTRHLRYKRNSPTVHACDLFAFGGRRERVVLDANVYIKAMNAEAKGPTLATRDETLAHHVVTHALKHADVYASSETLGELEEMIATSDRINSPLDFQQRRAYFLFFKKHISLLQPAGDGQHPRCAGDPRDTKYLAAGCSCSVCIDRIVSDDFHLTNMSPLAEGRPGLPIIDSASYVSALLGGADPHRAPMSTIRMCNSSDFPKEDEVLRAYPPPQLRPAASQGQGEGRAFKVGGRLLFR